MNPVSIQNVTFTYDGEPQPALQALTLDIPAQQICGLIGTAGAGKSTLCALAAGFIPQFYNGTFAGQALVDGQNVVERTISELVRHVGLVSANPFSQISGARFSVFEEVAFGLENLGLARDDIEARVLWALDAMQITDLRDRSPYALSGGQQQRMVIAATLAQRPPVLVLDEPTGQLDPPSVEELGTLLRELARAGTTILVAEQRLEWLAALADRVIALDHGRIIADGNPQAVLADPLLIERSIGWPRPATLAAQLREQGQISASGPLPVTEDTLLAAISAARQSAERRVQNAEHNTQNSKLKTQNSMPIVALADVSFAYPSGVEALKGVSLTIGAGEQVAILGRNGAGKSTLVRHFNGLLKPSSGQVLVQNADTHKQTVAMCARHVGIVFQDVRNQLFARTVREEVRFGPRNLRYDIAQVERLVDGALDALGLRAVADTHPYDLPPAMRRLVAVAAVLAMNTALVVLDEPTAGLDSAAITRLTAVCRDLAAQGRSVAVITHDLDFSHEALDRVVLVRDGAIALDSTWASLDENELALLNENVGLPLAVRVAQALA